MPAQGQVVANIGAYVALVETQQLALKNRLDLIAPEAGGAAVLGGNLDMKSNNITNAAAITVGTLNWTKASPEVYGLQYAAGVAGTALANTTTETSLLPATASGTLVFPANKWTPYSVIKFKAAMTAGVTATPTLTLRLKLNGTAIITHVLSPTTTAGAFMEAEIIITSTTNAMLESRAAVSGILGSIVTSAATTVDTTIVNTLTFTGQWSAASASNTVTPGLIKCEYMQA
jgi:hypothetical protein